MGAGKRASAVYVCRHDIRHLFKSPSNRPRQPAIQPGAPVKEQAMKEQATKGPMRRKGDLPQKPCATCGRPFAWRRKWAKVWDEVRHCSDACRRARSKA